MSLSAGSIFVDYLRTGLGIGLCITVPMNLFFYALFLCTDTNTLVDAGWSINQFLLAALFFALRETGDAYGDVIAYVANTTTTATTTNGSNNKPLPLRNILCLIFVFLWAARLGGFIILNRVCHKENDARYEALARGEGSKKASDNNNVGGGDAAKNNNGTDNNNNTNSNATKNDGEGAPSTSYKAVGKTPSEIADEAAAFETRRKVFFFFQFFFQAILLVFPATPPLYFLFGHTQQSDPEVQWTFWVGLAIATFGVVNTGIADQQMENYKHESKKAADEAKAQGRTYTKGLCRDGWWSKSRHPNLFFEVMAWVGFSFMAIDPTETATLISLFGFVGPLLLFLIMKYVTVPATEESMQRSRPNWDELIKDTNMFLIF